MTAFPWDTEASIQKVPLPEAYKRRYGFEFGPATWACEFLEELGEEIRHRNFDGRTPVDPIRFATASGHGIGKSTLVSWLILFIMSTRPHCKGVVTANQGPQLREKTWAELSKWYNVCLTKDWFTLTSTYNNMVIKHNEHPETWRCVGTVWDKDRSEAFAGQHAATSTSFYIFDEASGIHENIFKVRAGGLTDGEPMTFDFGNPTRNSGSFYENCVGRNKHNYRVRQIDSRLVEGANIPYLDEIIEEHGADSDEAKRRVLGQFPDRSSEQFIKTSDVDAAIRGEVPRYDASAPLVIGIDVGRFGDDYTVIYPRMGYDARTFQFERYKGLTNVQVSGKAAELAKKLHSVTGKQPSAIYVDVDGVGAGVADILRAEGWPVVDVHFGGSPVAKDTYRYRVDEMWARVREALSLGKLKLCDDRHLRDQLLQREYGYTTNGKISLESKKEMKERLGAEYGSPDVADALALTFAGNVAADWGLKARAVEALSKFNPFEGR